MHVRLPGHDHPAVPPPLSLQRLRGLTALPGQQLSHLPRSLQGSSPGTIQYHLPVLGIRDVYPGSEFFPSRSRNLGQQLSHLPRGLSCRYLPLTSVGDRGCLSRIRIFSILDPGSKCVCVLCMCTVFGVLFSVSSRQYYSLGHIRMSDISQLALPGSGRGVAFLPLGVSV